MIWNQQYYESLVERFDKIKASIGQGVYSVAPGRVAPALEDITIGSARRLRAAILFFDVRGFTKRCGSSRSPFLEQALVVLDCVIPMVMHLVHDHEGYVEKNTGDGVMAIIGADKSDNEAAAGALAVAERTFYVLEHVINPYLTATGIARVDARIGIDLGSVLIARIGVASGTARHSRNFLTAVGPTANLACRIQQQAGTNEIWVGDLVKRNAPVPPFQTILAPQHFRDVTPPLDWTWIWEHDGSVYRIWAYQGRAFDPNPFSLPLLLSALASRR